MKKLLEDHLAIDLPTIMAAMNEQRLSQWGHTLAWGQDGRWHELQVFVDLSDPDDQYLWLEASDPKLLMPPLQRIEIKRTRRGRTRLICPVSGSLADALFVRDGRVAAAKVQNLEYRSQMGRRARRSGTPFQPVGPGRGSAAERAASVLELLAETDAPPEVRTSPERRAEILMELELNERLLEEAERGNIKAIFYFVRKLRLWYPDYLLPRIVSEEEDSEFLAALKEAELASRRRT